MGNQRGDDLLALAISEPRRAMAIANADVRNSTDPTELSYAHQALGIALRDRGEIDLAIRHLRTALQLAGRTNDHDRDADVRATVGATLAVRGRTVAGLRELDEALRRSTPRGAVRPKVLMRRANVLVYAGHHDAALADLLDAVRRFRRSNDAVWEARALNLRAWVRIQRGEFAEAERDLRAAGSLFAPSETTLDVLDIRHNLALLLFIRGDVPGALTAFAELAPAYADHGDPRVELVRDQAHVLLAAGLSTEAVDVLDSPSTWAQSRPRERAELLVMRAAAQLGAGRPGLALDDARAASRQFGRQERNWSRIRADLVALRARIELGRGSRRAAVALADSLLDDRTEDGALAALLAGRELAATDPAGASTYLSRAAIGRHRGSPLSRSTAWLAHALDLEVQGRPRVLQAVGHGLDALAEHRASLGSPELRALTAIHSADLSALAVRHALPRGPRALAHWTDRGRAASLSEPIPAPQDPVIDGLLAAIRGLSHRIVEEADPDKIQMLTRERTQKERAVRLAWAATSGAGGHTTAVTPAELADRLDDRILVQLVNVDGTLYAVVVRDGRWRRLEVGPLELAQKATDRAMYGLRGATRGRPIDLAPMSLRLESALLGPVARMLTGDRSVVISPPAAFLGAPWGLLPALHDRPFSVTPSATSWARARGAEAPSSRAVFVAGPGLPSGGGEVASLASGASSLVGSDATVARVLASLDGASLAHIAAHGSFRSESPMFSSLNLADGPLTVDDIHRLDHPPHRIVLPACRSGVVAAVGGGGGQDVIGFASALLTQGTAGVIASIADVEDASTVRVMLDLHAGLARGERLDEALAGARRASYDEAVRHATAVLFAAMGAA